MHEAVVGITPSGDLPTGHSAGGPDGHVPASHKGVASTDDNHEYVRHALEHAIHFLPTQGPISVFVHHNTLHSFEDMTFAKAVVEAGKRYACEPYLSEDRYHRELHGGRIAVDDLREMLMDDLGDGADDLVATFGTRYTLRLAMLQMTLHSAPESELKWLLAETDLLTRFREGVSPTRRQQMIQQTRHAMSRLRGVSQPTPRESRAASPETVGSNHARAQRNQAVLEQSLMEASGESIESWREDQWEAFVLKLLWRICRLGVEAANLPPTHDAPAIRVRDRLLDVTGEDIDTMVNEVMVRFCAAFLDQGLADWEMPHRDRGFARAFASLYLRRFSLVPQWMRPAVAELQKLGDSQFNPIAMIDETLRWQGVGEGELEETVVGSLLSLRGWAGMIWQMESAVPFLTNPVPAGTLSEYLAIRMLLERHAIADVGRRHFGCTDCRSILVRAEQSMPGLHQETLNQRTFTIFQLAQACGWTPEQLLGMSDQQWACLVREIEAFSSLERRRILHAAYERHYAVSALDAIAIHASRRKPWLDQHSGGKQADYLAVFCIDDREESFRRHLEEIDPACQTASAAGFFAVAMYYQGADHADFRPLCPNIITPLHYVREEPMFSAVDDNRRRAERRRQIGMFSHHVHSGSRTMLGGWVTGVFGAVATFPMVARILAPRLTSRVRESVGTWVRPPATELHIERIALQPGPETDALGYSLEEMSGIVVRILQDIGKIRDFPPMIVFFGHGSSSLNNPHESAYNCGACSGGRGGPNARAFALMANDPRVRRLISLRGIEIPDDVRFVGAYHNTCSDSVEYYDLDLLPRSHRELFRRVERSIQEARARNAQERVRRFESASLDLRPHEALEHVEQRSEDLSQARPEYNHATNAMVVVGRRDWTRGLFMDRRAFVTSYDPSVDDEQSTILSRILQAVIPVCAGISLEYYFSTVDNEGYGCGSKLPHNVTSMIGVMTGAASDLRPGLSQQMVEIHEPMRILFVVETTAAKMHRILQSNPGIGRLVQGNWVQLALIDPETSRIQRYVNQEFVDYSPYSQQLPQVDSSMQWYQRQRDHLGFASIMEATRVREEGEGAE